MNRTVRDVGGLILSIILMVSLYGTYKGGNADVGGAMFGTMHRDVGRAFKRVTLGDFGSSKWWSFPDNSTFSDQSEESVLHGIPKDAWRKGVHVRGAKEPGVIKQNKDGSWSEGPEGFITKDDNPDYIVVQHAFAQVAPNDPKTQWAESPKDAHYDPTNRTLTFTNWGDTHNTGDTTSNQ